MTAWTVTLVPAYWVQYGPTNFLWFSDLALFALVLALWLESRILVSVVAVVSLLPELIWNLDLLLRLLAGVNLVDATTYMLDAQRPLWLRLLSLFHIPLPPLTLWLLLRVGYDRRALLIAAATAWIVLPASLALTDPASNINWTRGPFAQPQTVMHPLLYLACLMVGMPLLIYLPTHLVLSRLVRSRQAERSVAPSEPRGADA